MKSPLSIERLLIILLHVKREQTPDVDNAYCLLMHSGDDFLNLIRYTARLIYCFLGTSCKHIWQNAKEWSGTAAGLEHL